MTCLFDKQVTGVSWQSDRYTMLQQATKVRWLPKMYMKTPPHINSLLMLILSHHSLKVQVSEGLGISMGAQHHRVSEPRYMVQSCQVDRHPSKGDRINNSVLL